MNHREKRIPRISPKAYDYVKQVLDFGFHNAHSVGITARLEREFAARFGQKYGIAHCNGTATMQSALMGAGVGAGVDKSALVEKIGALSKGPVAEISAGLRLLLEPRGV